MQHSHLTNYSDIDTIISDVKTEISTHDSWSIVGEDTTSGGKPCFTIKNSNYPIFNFNVAIDSYSPDSSLNLSHIEDKMIIGISESANVISSTARNYINNQTNVIVSPESNTIVYANLGCPLDKNTPKINIFINDTYLFVSFFDSELIEYRGFSLGFIDSFNTDVVAFLSLSEKYRGNTGTNDNSSIFPVFCGGNTQSIVTHPDGTTSDSLISSGILYKSPNITPLSNVTNISHCGPSTSSNVNSNFYNNKKGIISRMSNDYTFGSVFIPVKFYIVDTDISDRPSPIGNLNEVFIVNLNHIQNDSTITIGSDDYYVIRTTMATENDNGVTNSAGQYHNTGSQRPLLGFAFKLDSE